MSGLDYSQSGCVGSVSGLDYSQSGCVGSVRIRL